VTSDQIIGWVGNIVVLAGCFLLMRKQISGFLVSVLGNIAYLLQGIVMTNFSLITLNVLLMMINCYSWMVWKHEFKRK
jgi:nicotinamide riboside transporter PnuC